MANQNQNFDLNLWWDKFNQELFQGEMDKPDILPYRQMIYSLDEKNNRGYMFGCYQSAHNLGGTKGEMLIWINVEDGDILDTLLHEMCHQYVREILDDEEADMHGSEFNEIYDEVMAKAEKLYGKYPKSSSIIEGSSGEDRNESKLHSFQCTLLVRLCGSGNCRALLGCNPSRFKCRSERVSIRC